jgi:DNA-binding response OmpR family regulator
MAVTNARVQSTHADVSRYRRILLVEDEPVLRTSIRRNLELRGVFVTEARTVGEALTSARGDLPDLVVLDINLPDGSGWDFLRELRASGSVPPTVVMSAGRVTRARLREFGIEVFLLKPFLIEALAKLVTANPAVRDR